MFAFILECYKFVWVICEAI